MKKGCFDPEICNTLPAGDKNSEEDKKEKRGEKKMCPPPQLNCPDADSVRNNADI